MSRDLCCTSCTTKSIAVVCQECTSRTTNSIAVVCQEISAVLAVLLLTVWPSCVKRSLLLFFCSFGCRYMQMYTGVARVVRAVSSRVVKISASFFFVPLVNIVPIFI